MKDIWEFLKKHFVFFIVVICMIIFFTCPSIRTFLQELDKALITNFVGSVSLILAVSIFLKQDRTQEMIQEIEDKKTEFEKDRFMHNRKDKRQSFRLEAYTSITQRLSDFQYYMLQISIALKEKTPKQGAHNLYTNLKNRNINLSDLDDLLELSLSTVRVVYPKDKEIDDLSTTCNDLLTKSMPIFLYLAKSKTHFDSNLETMKKDIIALLRKGQKTNKDLPDIFRKYFVSAKRKEEEK